MGRGDSAFVGGIVEAYLTDCQTMIPGREAENMAPGDIHDTVIRSTRGKVDDDRLIAFGIAAPVERSHKVLTKLKRSRWQSGEENRGVSAVPGKLDGVE
jgi:hypothetical protein